MEFKQSIKGKASNYEPKKDYKPAFSGIFFTTFTTVFIAELGDKTQLSTLLLSAETGHPFIVFIGASLALITSSLIGVLMGQILSRVLPEKAFEYLAGISMIIIGLWLGYKATNSIILF